MEVGGAEAEEGVTRVLVVDDSPVDRRVAQLLLSSSSCAGAFHVIAVDSARKAMEFLGLKGGKVKRPLLASLFTPGFGIMHLSPADAKRNSAVL